MLGKAWEGTRNVARMGLITVVASRARAGKSDEIYLSRKQLRIADLKLLKHELGYCTGPKSLVIEHADLTDDLMPEILDIVRNCPNLERLDLSHNGLTAKMMEELADTVTAHPTLSHIRLHENAIGKGAGEAFARMIRHADNLAILQLSNNELTAEDAAPIGQALANSRPLRQLMLGNNPLGEDGAQCIIQALHQNRGLTNIGLQLGTEMSDVEKRHMVHDIIATKHPTLTSISPFAPAGLSFIQSNREKATNVAGYLMEDSHTLTLERIGELQDYRPVLEHVLMGHEYKKHNTDKATAIRILNRLMDSLPAIPEKPDIASLFAANETGFSPLENPSSWQKPEALFAALEKHKIPINWDLMARQTEHGHHFLEAAFNLAPLHPLMEQLNQRGIRLQAYELLGEKDQPNELLELAVKRGQVNALFHRDNWRGAERGELQRVMHALPKDVVERIPNRHALLASSRTGRTAERGA